MTEPKEIVAVLNVPKDDPRLKNIHRGQYRTIVITANNEKQEFSTRIKSRYVKEGQARIKFEVIE